MTELANSNAMIDGLSRISFRNTSSKWISSIMFGLCAIATMAIIGLLVLVTWYLVSIGASSIDARFFTETPIPPGMVGYPGGMKHALVGTVILIGLASIIGLPVGILAGIYLAEFETNSWLATPVRFTSDVLAGVPSIVVGVLGYELLVVPLGHYNGYAGALALAFIMIPIVTRTTEEMLRLVPDSYRQASIALGATNARTILQVVLPAAMGSVVTGVMLAVARVAGETAPLLFTALGSRLMSYDPGQPFPSLTLQIFTYAIGPYPEQKQQAWAGLLVLIALIFVLNVVIRFITRGKRA